MQNFQIYPSKKLYIPDDAFSKKLFNLTEEDYRKAIEEEKGRKNLARYREEKS